MAIKYLVPAHKSHYVRDCFNLEEFLEKRKEFENKMMLEHLSRFFTSGLMEINKELQKYYQFKWLTVIDIGYSSKSNSRTSKNILLILKGNLWNKLITTCCPCLSSDFKLHSSGSNSNRLLDNLEI